MSTTGRRKPSGNVLEQWRAPLYPVLRAIARQAGSFYTAFGIFLIGGAAIAILGTVGFAEVAEHVRTGSTQAFDDAVLLWLGRHRAPWIESSLLDVTALGAGLVVLTIVAVGALFLALTQHRYSAFLLLVAAAGGMALNTVLKMYFHRPRPQLFVWGTHVASSSFPSGHATNAAVVYLTVALLAARLQKRWRSRWLTVAIALLVIAMISVSRLYLGVHYPSDVLGGLIVGVAWAGFCMAALEAVRVFARRFRPGELRHEKGLGGGRGGS